jgi:hypothetical protein
MATNSSDFDNCKDIIFNDKLLSIHSVIMRDELATPFRYMRLLNTFKNICVGKKKYLEEKRLRLQVGN